MPERFKRSIAVATFVYLAALIVVVFSERVFWYWTPEPLAHLQLAFFYSLPVAAVVWLLATYRVSSGWGLLAVTPLFAYVTEGVLTPVMYSGGPFVPFFPAWFAAWHGLGSVAVAWFLLRRWMLDERWAALVAACAALGLFWGLWASTSLLPELVEDEDMIDTVGVLSVLEPGQFTLYVATVTTILAVAHVIIGFVWPRRVRPGRTSTIVLGALLLGGALIWTFAAPWALPMFVFYGWLQVRVLRRHRAAANGPTLLERFRGRIRIRAVVPLVAIVPVASIVYLVMWRAEPSDAVLRVVHYGSIAVQTVIGLVVGVLAWRRAGVVSA